MKFKDIQFTDRKFIRPVEDLKQFSGTVVYSDRLAEWKDYVISYANGADITISDDTEVLISPVRHIEREYRFFIVNGVVITGCQYSLRTKFVCDTMVPDNILHAAQTWAKTYTPSVAVVMDVAVLDNNAIKIIEFNNFNSAGLYACDVEKIILNIESLF